jgi:hypothetical protein
MFDALPPPRPAIVRAADLNGLPSWEDVQRRDKALREGSLGPLFPMRPRENASVSFTGTAGDATDSNSYSFAGLSIGAADPSRYVIAGIVGTGLNASSFSSVTIGGVSATQIVERANGVTDAAIYIAAVPTGTTTTVAANFSASKGRAMVFLWRAIGLRSASASATSSTATAVANVLSLTLAVPAFGFVVGIGADNATTSSLVWAGVNKDSDQPTAENSTSTGASANFSQQQTPLSVTLTMNATSTPCLAIASFR